MAMVPRLRSRTKGGADCTGSSGPKPACTKPTIRPWRSATISPARSKYTVPNAWSSSSWTRKGRTTPCSGTPWFQSRTSAGGSELRNGRYRVTGYILGGEFRRGTVLDEDESDRTNPVIPGNGPPPRRRSRDLDEHGLALDLHLVDGLLDLRPEGGLAGADVELPAVPGADHGRPLERPVGQRPPLVRADPVDGRDLSVDVEEGVDPALELHFLGAARRELIECRQLHELRHAIVSGLSRPEAGRPDADPHVETGPTTQDLHSSKRGTFGESG